MSAGKGWAVAAAVEVGEGDEVLRVFQAVGDPGQEPQLGVRDSISAFDRLLRSA